MPSPPPRASTAATTVPPRHPLSAAAGGLALLLLGCHREPDDVARGRKVFDERCALCHTASADSAQGPGLAGVVGRGAAENPTFGGYTRALRQSGITWKAQELDRFLQSPAQMVPGTRMVAALPDKVERAAVVRYLSTLAAGPSEAHELPVPATQAPAAAPMTRTGAEAYGGYKEDGPGVRRRFGVGDLRAPFATPTVRRSPRIVARPEGFDLRVPPGFRVELFAADLDAPRLLRTAPNGDLFVAESDAGQILALRPSANGGPPTRTVFARDLQRPFGLAFYPPEAPKWLYVGDTDAVLRFPYATGDGVARGPAETVVPALTATRDGHWTRDLAFSRDGARMFVSVGSASNVADTMPKRALVDAQAWERDHGLGAAWGDEDGRAQVRVMTPEGRGARAFATGIRNCVGMLVTPSDDLWCATNERDGLGDDLVPDYVTRVRAGGFYGWPWYYLGDHEDPRRRGERPDLAGKAIVPDVLIQAHSAALEPALYEGAMFPAAFRGSLFVALHGSWNRDERTGYKVVRVLVDDRGAPTGDVEDFLTGFVVDDDRVWGRPVGVAVGTDGSLYVSEDGNGTVWRVTYRE